MEFKPNSYVSTLLICFRFSLSIGYLLGCLIIKAPLNFLVLGFLTPGRRDDASFIILLFSLPFLYCKVYMEDP